MARTRIQLCGELLIELDGKRVDQELRGDQGRLLFSYLVLNRDRPVRRDELEAAVWGDGAPYSPVALAPPLSRLRRIVGPDRITGRSELRLVLPEDAEVDVEAALAGTTDLEGARRADAILTRELLPGVESPWLDGERDRLQEVRVEALEVIARESPEPAEAERAARVAVELAPFRESAWVALLDVLRARGNVAEALLAFERVRTLLREELGTVPSPALLAAHRALLEAQPDGPPVVAAKPARVLPTAALTPLIGRERECDEIGAVLAREDVRLLTLLGPGGIGKTRLALEVATRFAAEGGDPCFVDLTRISDPQQIVARIAWDLGLRSQGRRPQHDELLDYVRTRSLLLVLDNFEHVASAAPFVTELLQSAPRVKALVTSRTVLHVRGEHQYLVPPLPSGWSGAAAVQLFVQRAQALQPGFALTDENTADVLELCRRLDGIPLAIELAAARVRVLGVKTLLQRLEDRFAVLKSGARDAPERQRALWDTIAWSYDLLRPAEQRLFAQLGVFAGGFDLEAAQALVEHGCEVFDGLELLVDQSLVRVEQRDGQPRFSRLESLREFALEQLAIRGDADAVRATHAAFFTRLAAAGEAALKGPDQLAWLRRFEDDHDNLRAALRWNLDRGEIEAAVEMGWGLWMLWYFYGHVEEGVGWFTEMARRSGPLASFPRARALSGAGMVALGVGDTESARPWLAQGLDLYREAGDDAGVAIAAGALGLLTGLDGDPGRGRALIDESIALYRTLGDEWFLSSMLNFRARIAPDPAAALALVREALEISRAVDDTLPLLISLYNLAVLEHDPAPLSEGLELAVRVSDTGSIGFFLDALAAFADAERAAGMRARAAELLEESGGAWLEVYVLASPFA
ncbi:hypothetical protein OJ997_25805 [Solirubrobacter phytolaccae]|uniref:Bacterial transcriptional activator domain-containing protein n=1 Tax=Solirubrobacter phytolaccae TaxID=1404360 RepID=A0A9X3NCY1_9ACTN|nr:BTAD domain-containing putative transcriptional regulator [Solirubrobacter phytolaccae]MDA0183749.1 hypothetical protein [Solirubrobacter phytolaccae]